MQDENHNRQNDIDAHQDSMDTEPDTNTGANLQTDEEPGAPSTSGEELGNPIASGQGKDARWTPQFYLILLALAVLPIGAGYFFATQFGYRFILTSDVLGLSIPVRTVFYHVYICTGVVLAVVLVFVQLLYRGQLARTEIYVYENGIEGVGLRAGLGLRVLSGSALQPFCLLYGQVSQISAGQSAAAPGILISAQDMNLGVYPPNVAEVLEAMSRFDENESEKSA